jgi:DNA-binding response OmpR family regulator
VVWEPKAVKTITAMRPLPTILIVEDEAGMRALLEDILRLQGYRVLTAATVQEAEAARQRFSPGSIDLIISNIHLTASAQAHAGYALYQRWRAQHPGLPFLLLSGDPATEDLLDIRARAVRWLAKPFTPGELLEAARATLGR